MKHIYELMSSKGKVNTKKTFGDLKKGDKIYFSFGDKDAPLNKVKVNGIYKVENSEQYDENVYTNLSSKPNDVKLTYKIDLDLNNFFVKLFTVFVNENASWLYLEDRHFVAVDEEEYNEAIEFSENI